MIEALIVFGVMCLSAAVVCTLADGDDLDLWEPPLNQTNEEDARG